MNFDASLPANQGDLSFGLLSAQVLSMLLTMPSDESSDSLALSVGESDALAERTAWELLPYLHLFGLSGIIE